jgi:acetyl-CoA acetyltransferase family protein
MEKQNYRVAILGGRRTPFVKAGTVYKDISLKELGVHVLKAIVNDYKLAPETIDEFVFSSVLFDPRMPNWSREILFAAGLPKTVYADSVSNNCISGLVALTRSADRIALGRSSLAIVGGAETMSNPTLAFSYGASRIFLELFRARSFGEKLSILSKLRPRHFAPAAPAITEPSTGLTMGQHTEMTAKQFKISREAQDKLAFESHARAFRATQEGILAPFIAPLNNVTTDLLVRKDTTVEKLAKLPPVFDRKSGQGTLTAGNSSALTDGSAAMLIASEERAAKLGMEPLAYLTDYEFAALSPDEGLLMAPGLAVPRMLRRRGLKLEDFDLIEIHEAFSAQVEANISAWENGWKEEAVGKLRRDRLNTLGGSIALGHPFAATGGRIVTQLASELKRNNYKRGLVSICAAGGMAGAVILER